MELVLLEKLQNTLGLWGALGLQLGHCFTVTWFHFIMLVWFEDQRLKACRLAVLKEHLEAHYCSCDQVLVQQMVPQSQMEAFPCQLLCAVVVQWCHMVPAEAVVEVQSPHQNPSSISIRMAMSPGTGRNSKSGAAKILFVVQKIWLVPQISCLCRLAVHVRSHATLYGTQPIHIVPNPLQIFKVLLQSSVPITHPLHREMEVGSSCWPPSISRHWKGRMFSLYTCSSSRSAHQQKMTRSPNITCQPKCWPVHFGSIEGDYHLSFCSTTALGAQRHWARLCLKRPACLDCSEKNVCRNDIES